MVCMYVPILSAKRNGFAPNLPAYLPTYEYLQHTYYEYLRIPTDALLLDTYAYNFPSSSNFPPLSHSVQSCVRLPSPARPRHWQSVWILSRRSKPLWKDTGTFCLAIVSASSFFCPAHETLSQRHCSRLRLHRRRTKKDPVFIGFFFSSLPTLLRVSSTCLGTSYKPALARSRTCSVAEPRQIRYLNTAKLRHDTHHLTPA